MRNDPHSIVLVHTCNSFSRPMVHFDLYCTNPLVLWFMAHEWGSALVCSKVWQFWGYSPLTVLIKNVCTCPQQSDVKVVVLQLLDTGIVYECFVFGLVLVGVYFWDMVDMHDTGTGLVFVHRRGVCFARAQTRTHVTCRSEACLQTEK